LKVLHLSTGISPQSAPWRLHNALLKEDIDSYVYVLEPSMLSNRLFYGEMDSIFSRIYYRFKFLLKRYFAMFIKGMCSCTKAVPISLGYSSMLNHRLIENLKPDVINLHWICGEFVSIEDLVWLSQFPLVWTLHDSWPFTGGCHIPQQCRKWEIKCESCKLMGGYCGIDLAKYIFNHKANYYKKTDFKVVGVSKWMAECAKKSALLNNKEVFCVHNTLNQNLFRPRDKVVIRDMLSLPSEKKLILFGAMNATSDENKGFKFLYEAIRFIVDESFIDNIELMVFGSEKPDNAPSFGVTVHYMGRLYDEISLSLLYSAADIMIVPSLSESFGQTILESLSCGTPVAAFRTGGIPDQIDHMDNGYLAKPFDSRDLARGIVYILNDKIRWSNMSKAARRKAVKCFSENVIASEMLKVYEKAIADKNTGGRN